MLIELIKTALAGSKIVIPILVYWCAMIWMTTTDNYALHWLAGLMVIVPAFILVSLFVGMIIKE